jgi:N-acetylglucosamine-6-phosphate deacetylase
VTAITAERIFTGESWLTDHAVVTENNKIESLTPLAALPSGLNLKHAGEVLAPAFIDLQIYGAYKKLFAVYPTVDCLDSIVGYSEKGGAAHCLPTLATNTKETFFKGIDAIRQYWAGGRKSVLGLHMEGPWINPAKRGAHISELIHKPSLEEVKEILDYGKGVIKMITLAPEICNEEIIDYIVSQGILVSAGHTDADYATARKSFSNGIRAITHLFNAMSPLQHRAPGMVGAAMKDDKVFASIIADGHHVDFNVIAIASKIMGERLFLITDAVTETTTGFYRHQPAGDKFEANGVLSGSALTMFRAVRNVIEFSGIDESEALRMGGFYPAKLLGLNNQVGRISVGFEASMVSINGNVCLLV